MVVHLRMGDPTLDAALATVAAVFLVLVCLDSLLLRRRARRTNPEVLRTQVLARLRPPHRPLRPGPWVLGLLAAILGYQALAILDPRVQGVLQLAALCLPALVLIKVADALVRLLVTDRYARALIGEEPPAGPESGT